MGDSQATILAIVTTEKNTIIGGGAPIFVQQSEAELQKMSMYLEKILDASAHELNENIMIIVAR